MNAKAIFNRKNSKYQLIGLLFIAPWLIGFLVLQLYPLLSSLYYSFFNYSGLGKATFVGLKNYTDALAVDVNFWPSLKVTLIYVLVSVPLKLIVALMFALILNLSIRFVNFFRTVYYLPSILGGSVAIAILWRVLFMKDGLINTLLNAIHIPSSIDWIGDPRFALFTISLLPMWQFGSSMVLFLAGLKQISKSLYEAAKVEGANKVRMFFSITIPHLTPIILFNLVMQTIIAFQDFTAPFLITNGGPANETYLYGLMLYQNAFQFFKMGYASALSWLLFIVMIIFTVVLFKSSSAWAFYREEG